MKFDLEKIKDAVIHCNTEEKANSLLSFLDKQGCHIGYTLSNKIWQIRKEQTCYRIEYGNVYHGGCNWYEDNDYTILEFEDVIIPDQPRICEILGVKVNEKFNIKKYENNPCKIKYTDDKNEDDKKVIVVNKFGMMQHITLVNLIEHPELIEKIPEWTDEQKEAFKTLKEIFHIKYIIRNKSEMILGCRNQPTKFSDGWEIAGEFANLNSLANHIFEFVKYEDEPFEIPEV